MGIAKAPFGCGHLRRHTRGPLGPRVSRARAKALALALILANLRAKARRLPGWRPAPQLKPDGSGRAPPLAAAAEKLNERRLYSLRSSSFSSVLDLRIYPRTLDPR